MYPKPSSKTVTNGDEGEVHGGNARALGEVVRLDLTLDDLLVTGVYCRKAQCSSTKRLYFSSTISIRMTMMITNVWTKLCKLRDR